MQILWTSLDTRSKEIAMSEMLDESEYNDLYEHIDLRYKIHFGHMDYKSTANDDHMGLALVADSFRIQKVDVGAGWPVENEGRIENGDLDAM